MAKHSKIGASGAYRWFACPGSVNMIAMAPKQEQSVYAAEGSAAHELCETCLISGGDAVDHFGTEINGFEVTHDMVDAVQLYIDTVREDLTKDSVLGVEAKFHLDHIHPDLFGTNDAFVAEDYKKVIVYDFKYGQGVPVEVQNNKQMMYYAVNLVKEYDPEFVELVIVQPRCPHKDGPVRRWTISGGKLTKWAENDLKEAAFATEDPNAPLNAGGHCQFCPAAGMCPALKNEVNEIAKATFEDEVIHLPAPTDLKPEEISHILKNSAILDGWIKQVAAYAQNQLENDIEIPGYKLVRKTKYRKWKSDERVKKALEKDFGEDIYVPQKLLSPVQMEKMLGTNCKDFINDLWEQPEGDITIAKESDPKPAISGSPNQRAIEQFKDVV